MTPPLPPPSPSGDPRDPLAGFAPRHPAVARVVLDGLRVLAASGDPGTRRWAADVLAGRRPVRDLAGTEGLAPAVEAGAARVDAADDDERAALAEHGRARAEDLLRRDQERGSGRG